MTNDPALKQLAAGLLEADLQSKTVPNAVFLDQGGDIHNTSQAKDLYNIIFPQ